MKQARKSLRVMIVSFLFTLVVVPFSNVQRTLPEHFPFQGAAWAAEDQSYLTEPFAVQPQEVPDPLESLNRGFFKFNDRFYFWVLKPVSQTYKTLVPQGVRTSVRNAFQNVAAPVRIVNNLLQLKIERTGIELARLVINSTLGFGGFFDFADTQYGLQPQYEDTGLTFGHYGMKPLMYINWPFVGPSNVRDTFGLAGDTFLNPISYFVPIYVTAGAKAGETVNNTSLRIGEYEDFKKSALDPYVAMRDAYTQYRAKQLSK